MTINFDMLTRIRNATLARQARVEMPSRLKVGSRGSRAGVIQSFNVLDAQPGERVQARCRFLKYGPRGERVITGLERVSRQGRRVYFGRDDVPDVLAGLGTSILTTSRGVMTGREAVKVGVGGGSVYGDQLSAFSSAFSTNAQKKAAGFGAES
jgi:small subunit ribosomal protein S8